MKFNYTSQRHQSGAILLTVLIVMTMMIVLIATASSIMSNRITLAYEAKEQIFKKALVQAKINELTYLATTQRFTAAGLSTGQNRDKLVRKDGNWLFRTTGDELRIDGFEYSEIVNEKNKPKLLFVLQSENGLIPLNTASNFWLTKWLESYNIDESQRQKYIDTLHDYIDADLIPRAAGAEDESYQHITTMDLPTNYFIQDCAELALMPHWSELSVEHPSLLQECSTEYLSSVNINATPPALLKKLWPDKAGQILIKRSSGNWLNSIEDLRLIVNHLDLSNELFYRFAANSSLIITVRFDGYTETRSVDFGVGLEKPFTFKIASVFAN